MQTNDHYALQCELVTPEKAVLCVSAQQITIPGAMGEFGVLPGHEPLVSALKPGVLTVQSPHHDTHRFAVTSGVAEISARHCVILAESAIDITHWTAKDAHTELERSKAAWESQPTQANQRLFEMFQAVTASLN